MRTPLDTITQEINGYTVRIKIHHDEDMGPPWGEHDGDSCWGYEGKTYMIEEAEGSAEAFVANLIETAKATEEALCWP